MAHAWGPENKYNEVLEVPEELWAARDSAIAYALRGGPVPEGLAQLKSWFSDDFEVYENLRSEASFDAYPALDLNSTLYAADEFNLRQRFELSEDDIITDVMRIDFTRKVIAEDPDGDLVIGVGSRLLEGGNGQSCVVGYTERQAGHNGILFYWEGVFADEKTWLAHIAEIGRYLYNYDEIADIPDTIIMEIYNKANP